MRRASGSDSALGGAGGLRLAGAGWRGCGAAGYRGSGVRCGAGCHGSAYGRGDGNSRAPGGAAPCDRDVCGDGSGGRDARNAQSNAYADPVPDGGAESIAHADPGRDGSAEPIAYSGGVQSSKRRRRLGLRHRRWTRWPTSCEESFRKASGRSFPSFLGLRRSRCT